MTGNMTDNQNICLTMLRDSDRDRYLCCLLSPAGKRDALAAIYAFNAELARIRDLVHEPLPGEVRLQYWRDLLSGNAHGSTQANPVAAALLNAIETYDLPRQAFLNMLDARVFDLYDDPMESRSTLEGYAGETASAVIQLAGLVLEPSQTVRSADAAGHAGVAQAIAGMLLLMPLHRHRGQVYLPVEILNATGLDRDTFLEGKDKARISAAIEAFAGLGCDHLTKARQSVISEKLFAAFLPVAVSNAVLVRAQKAGAGLFERPVQLPQWRRQLQFIRALIRKRI
jgi:15-cis-phytoene synthase